MAYCCVEQHFNAPDTLWCHQCNSLVAGIVIGDYRVVSHLGDGSFSTVYLAEQQSLNHRYVVIKILHQDWDQGNADYFQREAALLASLTHPYILPIHAYGVIYEQHMPVTSCSPYLVLPYAEQGSIAEAYIREGRQPWSLDRVVSLARDVAEALDYAHSRGVLHRDVKPANLLQMGTHVLLSDFSVASMIDANSSHLRAPWAGSPAYMAPEVWGLRPGRYSDQYALAVTCFYLLTGQYPWGQPGESSTRVWLDLHRSAAPRSLDELRFDLPLAANSVLQRALAKDPHERYATVQAFAADLLAASQVAARGYGGYPTTSDLNTLLMPVLPASVEAHTTTIGARLIAPRDAHVEAHPDAVGARLIAPRDAGHGGAPGQQDASPQGTREGRPYHDREMTISNQVIPGVPPAGTLRTQWWALLFNLLLCVLLAGEAYWQTGEISLAGNLLLALWPSLLIGLEVGRRYGRIHAATLAWAICWGVLFGITDVLLSALACYAWTALALTIPHWGHDWLQAGDGLHILMGQVRALAPTSLKLLVFSLWAAVIGGAVTGAFNVQDVGAKPVAHQT